MYNNLIEILILEKMEAYVKILTERRVLREEMNEQNLLSFRQAFSSVFHKKELF